MHPAWQPIEALTGPLQFDHQKAAEGFRKRMLKRGEVWLAEGEVCRKICFVESGLLRHIRQVDEQPLTRWASLPGQYAMNFPSFVQQTPAQDSIVAAAPSVLYEMSRECWASLRQTHAQLQTFWVAILEYMLVCFEDRVVSLISGSAADRYQYMIDRYPDFLLQLPQHYVADILGIAPRHLSRIRAELSRGEGK